MKEKIRIADIVNAFELGLIDRKQTESKLFDLLVVSQRSELFLPELKKKLIIKIFKVAKVRELDQQCMRGEISYSRKVELINEFANKALNKEETLHIDIVSNQRQLLIVFREWLEKHGVNNAYSNGDVEMFIKYKNNL